MTEIIIKKRLFLGLTCLLSLPNIGGLLALDPTIPHAPPDEETHNSFDIKAISVEDALSAEEIHEIIDKKNFFLREDLDSDEHLWNKLERKYSRQFFKNRTQIYDLPTVLRTVLQHGMPMRYQLNSLYRGGLEPHIALGATLPSLALTVGDGMSPISINNAFNGLFNFILPQNWLALIRANKSYDLAKYLFMQLALDQYYSAELLYINIHKLIYDLEIYNFYLMHLELFTRIFPKDEAAVLMVRGKMASVAGDMANIRTNLRLSLDQLALMMALTADRTNHYGASKINIKNLPNFSEKIDHLEQINPLFANKDTFIREVVNRSIEMRAINELYEISKLNIGITAFGQMFGVPSRGTPAQIVLMFNYGVIPQILFSKSQSESAKIDVENQFLKMINAARTSWDTYKYNAGAYVESQRSLVINRKAVEASLVNILDHGAKIDGVFLNSVIQLIDAHIKLNASVHSAQGALAQMRRLMVTEEENIINYIPVKKNVNDALKLFVKNYGPLEKDDLYLDNLLRTIHHKRKLEKLLQGDEIRSFSTPALNDAILRNSSFLLYRRWNFPKSRRFFQVLKSYVDSNKIPLNECDSNALSQLAKRNKFTKSKKNSIVDDY